MFVIEAAIHHAARAIGVETQLLQERNLLEEGSEFSYGQKTEDCEAQNCWVQAKSNYNFEQLQSAISRYNVENKYTKKGLAFNAYLFWDFFLPTP